MTVMSASAATAVKHKILLLDDDPDVLDLYQQMLLQLPIERLNSVMLSSACFASLKVCRICAEICSSVSPGTALEIVLVTTLPSRSTV